MVFVPSRAGLSHVPEEWTAPGEIATGVQVLAAGLLRLDRDLTELAGRR
jgi:acetylornithine deacetylase/succinyl-diaminopimelate desuccinylase-like protein